VSTPTSVELPDGVRRVTVATGRGRFAALVALPASGASEVCEREAALLVPGYTGSKEDFLAILGPLAEARRRVVAIDMRGQFETAGADDAGGYSAAALAADIAEIVRATGARHLLGHSYGGLIAREAVLAEAGLAGTGQAGMGPGLAGAGPDGTELCGTGPGLAGTGPVETGPVEAGRGGSGRSGDGIRSLTLMSSGPGALDGGRAEELRAMLAVLGAGEAGSAPLPSRAVLAAGMASLWREYLEPQAVAAGVPGPIVAFLGKRMLGNDPDGLVLMGRHLLTAPDRTHELARLAGIPMLVIYGEDDNTWSPALQADMALRLGASRVCVPGAAHSPAVEAPAMTASALTRFWDAAEAATATRAAGLARRDAGGRLSPPGRGRQA
jgi:pimeloyl-ACP methyl ester carboxylesterase